MLNRGLQALSPDAFEAAANETGALMLDTRDPESFSNGFIPNAINIGIDGNFAPWVGALITDIKQPILLISPKGREEEVVTRLARVGYDHAIGYLEGGFEHWRLAGKEIDTIPNISAEDFAKKYQNENLKVIDVRKTAEFETGHVAGAENHPLDFINQHMQELSKSETQYVHCAGGYRSMIALSILRARGFENLVNIQKGFGAIAAEGVKVQTGVTV